MSLRASNINLRPSQRLRAASQPICVSRSRPSRGICAKSGHESRVRPYIIARRYTYAQNLQELKLIVQNASLDDQLGRPTAGAEPTPYDVEGCDQKTAETLFSSRRRGLAGWRRDTTFVEGGADEVGRSLAASQ